MLEAPQCVLSETHTHRADAQCVRGVPIGSWARFLKNRQEANSFLEAVRSSDTCTGLHGVTSHKVTLFTVAAAGQAADRVPERARPSDRNATDWVPATRPSQSAPGARVSACPRV
jgi:hypothetical protein